MTENQTVRARILVYPRPEILDPQGKAIGDSLGRLGFNEVREVRSGKCFHVELAGVDGEAARARLGEMCERLLANPVVEDFEIEVLPSSGTGS